MSNELISLLVLVLIFVIGTTMPVNMGVLGIVAAFAVGTAMGVSEDDIFLGFPGDQDGELAAVGDLASRVRHQAVLPR